MDPITAGALSNGLNMGGGSITPSSSASSSNKGGSNSLGGFQFGDYYASSSNYTTWAIIAGVVLVAYFLLRGKR